MYPDTFYIDIISCIRMFRQSRGTTRITKEEVTGFCWEREDIFVVISIFLFLHIRNNFIMFSIYVPIYIYDIKQTLPISVNRSVHT